MTVLDSSNLPPRQVYQSLIDRLNEFRRHVRGRLLFEGLVRLLAATVLLAVVTFILDRVFRLSLPARVTMIVAVGIALCIVIWRELIAPLRLKLDPLTLAAALDRMSGRTDGFITSRVGTVLELPATLQLAKPPSMAMVHLAASQKGRDLVTQVRGERADALAVALQQLTGDERRLLSAALPVLEALTEKLKDRPQ